MSRQPGVDMFLNSVLIHAIRARTLLKLGADGEQKHGIENEKTDRRGT